MKEGSKRLWKESFVAGEGNGVRFRESFKGVLLLERTYKSYRTLQSLQIDTITIKHAQPLSRGGPSRHPHLHMQVANNDLHAAVCDLLSTTLLLAPFTVH